MLEFEVGRESKTPVFSASFFFFFWSNYQLGLFNHVALPSFTKSLL